MSQAASRTSAILPRQPPHLIQIKLATNSRKETRQFLPNVKNSDRTPNLYKNSSDFLRPTVNLLAPHSFLLYFTFKKNSHVCPANMGGIIALFKFYAVAFALRTFFRISWYAMRTASRLTPMMSVFVSGITQSKPAMAKRSRSTASNAIIVAFPFLEL